MPRLDPFVFLFILSCLFSLVHREMVCFPLLDARNRPSSCRRHEMHAQCGLTLHCMTTALYSTRFVLVHHYEVLSEDTHINIKIIKVI